MATLSRRRRRSSAVAIVLGRAPATSLSKLPVNRSLDTGQRSEMAESLLNALEGSLRIFEKHQGLIVSRLLRQPSK